MDEKELRNRFDRLKSFLQQDQDNLTLFQDCFDAAIQLAEFTQAEELLANLSDELKSEPVVKYSQSKLALSTGDYQTAKAVCDELKAAGVSNLAVQFNASYADFGLGNHQAVVDSIDQLGDAKQDYPPFLLLEARALHHLGRIDEAVFLTEHYFQENPNSAEAGGLLSMLLLDSEKYQEAENLAAKLYADSVVNQETLITLSSVELNHQNSEKVQQILKANAAMTQRSGRLMLNLGQAQLLDMQVEDAENSLTKAADLMPQHIGTWHALAWSKMMLGKVDEAGECFQAAYDIDRNFAESHGGLAVVAINQGRLEEAKKLTKTSLRLDPNCSSGRYAEALLLEKDGQAEVAKDKINNIINQAKTIDGQPVLDVVAKVAGKLTPNTEDDKS